MRVWEITVEITFFRETVSLECFLTQLLWVSVLTSVKTRFMSVIICVYGFKQGDPFGAPLFENWIYLSLFQIPEEHDLESQVRKEREWRFLRNARVRRQSQLITQKGTTPEFVIYWQQRLLALSFIYSYIIYIFSFVTCYITLFHKMFQM